MVATGIKVKKAEKINHYRFLIDKNSNTAYGLNGNNNKADVLERHNLNVDECFILDSKFELDFYFELCKHIPREKIRIHPILIVLPENEKFPIVKWKVDFAFTEDDKEYFVECKGYIYQNDFVWKLRSLHDNSPQIFNDRLFLIGTRLNYWKSNRWLSRLMKSDFVTHIHTPESFFEQFFKKHNSEC